MVSAQRVLRLALREAVGRKVCIPRDHTQELAWRVFTKGVDRDTARAHIEIQGNQELGEKILHLTAIVG